MPLLRPTNLLLLAAVLVIAGVAAWFRSWGLLALVLVGGAGLVWYRLQVARSAATENFFGDMGEDTRLTAFQGSPSELPSDRAAAPKPAPPRAGH